MEGARAVYGIHCAGAWIFTIKQNFLFFFSLYNTYLIDFFFSEGIYYKLNTSLPRGSESTHVEFESHHHTLHLSTLHLPHQCPAAHYWDNLLGLPAAGHTSSTLNKASSAYLSWCKIYPRTGNERCRRRSGLVQAHCDQLASSQHWAVAQHLYCCLPSSLGWRHPSCLVKIALLLLMRWEQELQSFRSSSKLPVQCQICWLKVTFLFSFLV